MRSDILNLTFQLSELVIRGGSDVGGGGCPVGAAEVCLSNSIYEDISSTN